MDIDEIKALMEAMDASDLSEMLVEKNGWTLRLARGGGRDEGWAATAVEAPASPARPAPVPRPVRTPVAAPPAEAGIRSPLSGVVHFSPSPDAPPFVSAGSPVEKGGVVCLIEAMKMFNEVRADKAGRVEELLVRSGEDVEAGQLLVRIV